MKKRPYNRDITNNLTASHIVEYLFDGGYAYMIEQCIMRAPLTYEQMKGIEQVIKKEIKNHLEY